METFQLFAEELINRGSVWVTEDVTGDLIRYLGIETDINYMINYDTMQPINRVQFILH